MAVCPEGGGHGRARRWRSTPAGGAVVQRQEAIVEEICRKTHRRRFRDSLGPRRRGGGCQIRGVAPAVGAVGGVCRSAAPPGDVEQAAERLLIRRRLTSTGSRVVGRRSWSAGRRGRTDAEDGTARGVGSRSGAPCLPSKSRGKGTDWAPAGSSCSGRKAAMLDVSHRPRRLQERWDAVRGQSRLPRPRSCRFGGPAPVVTIDWHAYEKDCAVARGESARCPRPGARHSLSSVLPDMGEPLQPGWPSTRMRLAVRRGRWGRLRCSEASAYGGPSMAGRAAAAVAATRRGDRLSSGAPSVRVVAVGGCKSVTSHLGAAAAPVSEARAGKAWTPGVATWSPAANLRPQTVEVQRGRWSQRTASCVRGESVQSSVGAPARRPSDQGRLEACGRAVARACEDGSRRSPRNAHL